MSIQAEMSQKAIALRDRYVSEWKRLRIIFASWIAVAVGMNVIVNIVTDILVAIVAAIIISIGGIVHGGVRYRNSLRNGTTEIKNAVRLANMSDAEARAYQESQRAA